jgi:TPR repeat protein
MRTALICLLSPLSLWAAHAMAAPDAALRELEVAAWNVNTGARQKLEARAAQGDAAAAESLVQTILVTNAATPEGRVALEKWIPLSLASKTGRAYRMAGVCYEMGLGVEKSGPKALELYAQALPLLGMAAADGDTEAMRHLGKVNEMGNGTPKNPAKAFEWYQQAAQAGSQLGIYEVGACYQKGVGVEKNLATALQWFQKAAGLGSARAQCEVGGIIGGGHAGAPEDPAAALRWFMMSAAQGYPEGQFKYALALLGGVGTEANVAEGVNWLQQAAGQGNAGAQFVLGTCFEQGKGVARNPEVALGFYKASAAQGFEKAKERLAKLGEK